MGLTKTVYNPAALKAAQKTSEEALKKKQVRGEIEGTVATMGKGNEDVRNEKQATLFVYGSKSSI